LDSVLESHPELAGCVVACVHRGIRFLTHPRNAGRLNLRCPFGCRRHHRQQRSRERSAAYYRTAEGKTTKERLNARRCRGGQTATSAERDPPPRSVAPLGEASREHLPDDLSLEVALPLEGVVLDESTLAMSRMLPYVRMVVSLIEGIPIGLKQLGDWLRQALRQHSIARRRRADYVLAFLHQHPP
jgi:hypothetical protein